jgi:hypothetical protein
MLNDIVLAAGILFAGAVIGYWLCKSKKLNF